MSPITTSISRALAVASAFVILVAFGCTSTSTSPDPAVPEAAGAQPTPIASSKDAAPKTDVSARLEPVYFDTDRSALRPEARAALKLYAKAIVAHPEWGVVGIDGHCDERGSDAYNLELGERRAAAVARYLVEQGVPESRLETRSFGARRPAVPGHDETAWRYNRRSEIRGGDVLASSTR